MSFDVIKSYLSNRWQFTIVNGVKNTLTKIDINVPQGGILSPFLFLIFINDFHNHPIFLQAYDFADDTSLCESSLIVTSNVSRLSKDTEIIAVFFRINKLTLNLKKIKIIDFRKPSVKFLDDPVLTFNKTVIPCVSSIKYLGIVLMNI